MRKEQRLVRCSFCSGVLFRVSLWDVPSFDCVRKPHLNEKLEMRNGDAAHKNVEAPRSINNSDARRSLDSRFPVLNFPNIVRLTTNDKDFSLALKMTIRESDVSKSLSHQSRIPPDI